MNSRARLGLASSLLAATGALAACGPAMPDAKPISNQAERGPSRWLLSDRGLGPITRDTQATIGALRAALPGVTISAKDLGGGSGVVYELFEGSDKIAYIVPDDAPAADDIPEESRRYATSIFAIFATSEKVAVDTHTWRVGAPLTTDDGMRCECWGAGEVTACFRPGAHLRVIFEQSCADAERDGAKAMVGKPISRIMWKAVPDLVDDND